MLARSTQYRAVAPACADQRAAHRHRLHFAATPTPPAGELGREATLHDLSVYGCRIACRTDHPEGARLWLRLSDRAPIAASVVWNDGEHLGCRFDKPIDRNLVRALTLEIC